MKLVPGARRDRGIRRNLGLLICIAEPLSSGGPPNVKVSKARTITPRRKGVPVRLLYMGAPVCRAASKASSVGGRNASGSYQVRNQPIIAFQMQQPSNFACQLQSCKSIMGRIGVSLGLECFADQQIIDRNARIFV